MTKNLHLKLAALQGVLAIYFQTVGEVYWVIWCLVWAAYGVIMHVKEK